MASLPESTPSPLRVVFAGTPEFAAVALQALIDSPHVVCAVYTQPDRPSGRGRKLNAGPVKQLAQQHGLPVYQPVSLREPDVQRELAALASDVMVVAAYGLLLPPEVLAIPPAGCLNIHASLLPRWRGAAPIQRAVLAGDAETGVTIMQMDAGLDTGDMLLELRCPIGPRSNGQHLHDELAALGAVALLQTLDALRSGRLAPRPQDATAATYANKVQKEEARLDWGLPALQLDRVVRAFNPRPIAHTTVGEHLLRIWEAEPLDDDADRAGGTVTSLGKEGIVVACGSGQLRLLRVQAAGGKPQAIVDFLNGHPNLLHAGSRLG
ncbi:MAG: methionyl-tRNA formyltransferase [Pseudomonadota bacterium]|nr:MAG: methionyl-tRNA formyltransferase [Pseudomonadota bacterium]